jgi:hypothetical protein
LSEIIIQFPKAVQPEPLLQKIVKIYEASKVPSAHLQLHRFVALNCAIAYGRLGIFYPDECSKYLKECLKKVCYGFISSKTEDKTKHDSFLGLNRVILKNPQDFLLVGWP